MPAADALVIAGDVTPAWDHRRQFQALWLRETFTPWLRSVPVARIIGVAGNHDFIAEENVQLMRRLPWTYLCDETTDSGGIVIHGSPWSCRFGNWAFMASDDELRERWAMIPDDVELLVVHGPPYDACDLVRDAYGRDPHVGSHTLRERIEQLADLRMVVTGHIHEAYGSSRIGDVDVFNVSLVDLDYNPVHEIVTAEWS